LIRQSFQFVKRDPGDYSVGGIDSMKCEHAQEFFSDYIEKSLDKPAAVTLEAHLVACGKCRHALEGLRQTWDTLSAMPAVEAPADLAWRVVCRLQQERLEEMEARRRRPHPLAAWLRSLTPGAAFGYATLVAILFVALAFPLRDPIQQVIFGVGGSDPVIVAPRPAPVDATNPNEPLADFAGVYQNAESGQWFYRLVVTLPADQGAGQVTWNPLVTLNGQPTGAGERSQVAAAGQPQLLPIPALVGGSPVQGVLLRVERAGQPLFQKVIPIPANSTR
jgi:hypothetical protein